MNTHTRPIMRHDLKAIAFQYQPLLIVAENSALCREFGTLLYQNLFHQTESSPVSFRIPTTFR